MCQNLCHLSASRGVRVLFKPPNTYFCNPFHQGCNILTKFKNWSFLDQQEHSVQWSHYDHLVTVGLKTSDFQTSSYNCIPAYHYTWIRAANLNAGVKYFLIRLDRIIFVQLFLSQLLEKISPNIPFTFLSGRKEYSPDCSQWMEDSEIGTMVSWRRVGILRNPDASATLVRDPPQRLTSTLRMKNSANCSCNHHQHLNYIFSNRLFSI